MNECTAHMFKHVTPSLCSQYFLLRKHRFQNSSLQLSYKGMLSLFLQWKRNTKTFCDAWSHGTDGDVGDWKKTNCSSHLTTFSNKSSVLLYFPPSE